jgi:hypothetical protein
MQDVFRNAIFAGGLFEGDVTDVLQGHLGVSFFRKLLDPLYVKEVLELEILLQFRRLMLIQPAALNNKKYEAF